MANNIKKFREAAGLTQQQLAHKLGIEKISVYRHESGRAGLRESAINDYAKIFNCSPSQILSDENIPENISNTREQILNALNAIDAVRAVGKEISNEEAAAIIDSYCKSGRKNSDVRSKKILDL
jgi:transcriptional regulator with XRE-family HTH domain